MSTLESDVNPETAAAVIDDAARQSQPPADASEEAPAENESGAEEAAQVAAPAAYDSEARQRIPVTILLDDGRYDVALVCEPASDAVLLRYAKLCEAADAAEEAEEAEEGEELGAAQLTATSRAVSWLFKALMSDVEGIGEEGEEKPADWRAIFGVGEREAIIDRAVFGVEFVAPPAPKKGARPRWGSHLRAVVNRFRVPFDGRTVEVSHTLRKADAPQLAAFVSLYARTAGRGRVADANLEQFAAGYDALHVAHAGYKGGVPMHHKAAAYVHHMTRQGAAVRKN